MRLLLNIEDDFHKALRQVRCRIRFSQALYENLRVHGCWPTGITGQQSARQINRGAQANPSVEGGGVAITVGEMHQNTEETRLSNWSFRANQSASSDESGSYYDEVTLNWQAPRESDHTMWSARPMYAAAVLVCVGTQLAIEAEIQRDWVPPHPRSKADASLRSERRLTPRFNLQVLEDVKPLEALCGEVKIWTKEKNEGDAIPEGMPCRF